MATPPFQNAMSVREETIVPSFSIQATRPKNRTEGKIYRYETKRNELRTTGQSLILIFALFAAS